MEKFQRINHSKKEKTESILGSMITALIKFSKYKIDFLQILFKRVSSSLKEKLVVLSPYPILAELVLCKLNTFFVVEATPKSQLGSVFFLFVPFWQEIDRGKKHKKWVSEDSNYRHSNSLTPFT